MKPLHHRDVLEQHAKAFGEPFAEADLPTTLRWRTFRPITQRLYLWTWARQGPWLYARLHCAYGSGGLWRLCCHGRVREAWRAVLRHLGPLGAALFGWRAALVCLAAA